MGITLLALCLVFQAPDSALDADPSLPESARILHRLSDTRPDHFGWGIVGLGDVDADGKPDVYVGARCGVFGLTQLRGYGAVFSGATGERLYRVEGEDDPEGDAFGPRAFRVKDLDGDGADELAVKGEPMSNFDTYVKVFSGRTGKLLQRWDHAFDMVDLAEVSPQGKRRLALITMSVTRVVEHGIEGKRFEFEGNALALTGDVDGNGSRELLSLTHMPSGRSGVPLLVELRSVEDGTVSKAFRGPGDFGALHGVCVAGDVDRDGFVDLACSHFPEPRQSNQWPAKEERFDVVIVSGKDGSVLRKQTEILLAPGDLHELRNLGDMDGDGVPDLFVAQYATTSNAGFSRARIYSGADGHVVAEMTSTDWSFGVSAGSAGDIDGDGRPEIVVGQHEHGSCAGRAFVIALHGR